ncbi:MAG: ABC transporter ATP-binding protein [Desulfobacterales bacterium]|jgi:ABC-type Fe3+/spermidine/putrescine transport system ATPase subunit
MGRLTLDRLTLQYGRRTVVRQFSLSVEDGEMVSLLGPSGAGKTTILKAVAGLIRPHSGRILIDDRPVVDLPPEKRDAVLVFQKPLLFPFMNVAQNIGFGLRMRGETGHNARRRIGDIMEMTELSGFEKRKVHELSGGQQQRVALGRALVLRPAVLLLDEPLSSLDANLRQQMRELIQNIQTDTGLTTLFVTHDQSEALMMSHRVSLLLNGTLRQVGRPQELFHQPADPDVARFFGGDNLLTGRIRDDVFLSGFGRFPAAGANGNGGRRDATIRPEDIRISPAVNGAGDIEGEVIRTSFEGTATRVWVNCQAGRLVVLTGDGSFRKGQRVMLTLPPEKVRIFPTSGGGGLPPSPEDS